MRSAVLASLLLLACGHSAASSVPSQPAAAEPGKLPAGPPLVTPGERMAYRLSLQGVELATYTFSVGDVQDLAGARVVVVESHARSVGLANWVARIDDRFTSWIDVGTGRSRRFQASEFASHSKTNIEHTVIDLAARANDTVPVAFRLNEEPGTSEPQKVSLPDVWDYNAFIVALRAWEQPPGSKVTVEVFRSLYLWRVEMTIRGREKIQTALAELGAVPALRFDAHMTKLDRKGAKFPDTPERDLTVWISDDEGRVPLRTVARTDYGNIKMDLVDYQPGTGARLRP